MQRIKPHWQVSFLFWCLLFLSACTTSEAQTVYITRTGAKYHEGSCRYLRQSKIAIEIEEAKQQGYTACSVCDPDSEVEEEQNEETSRPAAGQAPSKTNPTTTTVKKSTVTSSQCTAYTKAGARCKRSASSNGKCWQHQ